MKNFSFIILNFLCFSLFADSSNNSNTPSTSNTSNTSSPDACSPAYNQRDAWSNTPSTINGPTRCLNGDSHISVINGPLFASNTHFKNSIVINGPVHTNHVLFDQSLVINGPADLISTAAMNSVTIQGPLYAASSTFGTVTLSSRMAKFNQSTLASVSMKDSGLSYSLTPSPMEIFVLNHSSISGAVSFSNSSSNKTSSTANTATNTPADNPELGLVYLDNTSKIHGPVNSGNIILWRDPNF